MRSIIFEGETLTIYFYRPGLLDYWFELVLINELNHFDKLSYNVYYLLEILLQFQYVSYLDMEVENQEHSLSFLLLFGYTT